MNAHPYARLLGTLCLWVAASASATTLAGRFDDGANAALVGSDLLQPRFDSPFEIANNVALYAFSVPVAGLVGITSFGFALGGADPYMTLFAGSSGTATFLDSNYAQAFSVGGDFTYAAMLPAGAYQVAIGVFANLSFAENRGDALGDGFTGLGTPQSLGDASYRIELSTPVPEPASRAGMVAGLIAFSIVGLARRRIVGKGSSVRRLVETATGCSRHEARRAPTS